MVERPRRRIRVNSFCCPQIPQCSAPLPRAERCSTKLPPSAFRLHPSALSLPPSAFRPHPSALIPQPSAFRLPPSPFRLLPSALCLPPSSLSLHPSAFSPCTSSHPSAIYEFILFCRKERPDVLAELCHGIKGALLGSEFPAHVYRDLIEEALGVSCISWYGHETPVFAPLRRGTHEKKTPSCDPASLQGRRGRHVRASS